MTPSEWSKAVIQRDGKCADCGALAPLHAHHIKPKSTHPELRFDLSNGAAVCPTCHWKRHRDVAPPRSQAKKRGPHRKTLARQVEHLEGEIARLVPRAGERIADLEREVRALKLENRRLRERLRQAELQLRPRSAQDCARTE